MTCNSSGAAHLLHTNLLHRQQGLPPHGPPVIRASFGYPRLATTTSSRNPCSRPALQPALQPLHLGRFILSREGDEAPGQYFAGQVLVSGMPAGALTWTLRHLCCRGACRR